jgi:hypothetical protein
LLYLETNYATHLIQHATQDLTDMKAQQENLRQELAELRGLA